MKIIRNILSVAGILLSLQLLHAQTALIGSVNDVATPIQAAQQDSVVQVAAEAQGLQLVPPDQVPRGGTFWWMMPNGNSAPLPCPPSDPNIPIYLIAPGQFLVDETGGRVVLNSTLARLQGATPTVASALEAQANAVVNLIAQVQTMAATPKGRFSPSMMMASSFAGSFAYGNSVYLKNMTATASSGSSLTAGFSITGGTNFVPYDILMTTNLLLPVSSWNWLGIGYTSNNYTFNGQPANQAFYMLAKPSKTMTVGFGNDVVAQCDVPVGLTNVLQVAGGGGQSLALKTDGTVVAWGQNYFGEGTVPPTLGRVAMISAGWYHNVALLTNGTVTAWGANNSMLFGGMYLTNVPSNLTNAIVISAQAFHSLALASNGTVVAWGYGGFGEASVPAGLSNVVAIAAGYQHNLAVKSDGTVFPWGRNYSGDCTIPTGLCNVVDVAAGVYHSLALLNNGTVIAWGDNSFGESSVPVGLSNVVAIAAAGGLNSGGLLATAYSLALKSDGSVVAWGSDEAVDPVGGLSNVIAMAAGADHALAVRTGPPTPVITLEPVDEYQVQGSNVTFTARGAGLYGVAYQWQTNGVNLSGATQAALTLTNVQPAQLVSYDVVVSNEAGSLVSSNASLYFVTPPVINSLTLPTNQVAIYQSNLLLSVSASAPGQYNGFPLSYQWQFNGSNIAKATSSSYTLHANAISFGAYSVLVSNAAGSTNAAWLVAVYYPGLLISQQPTNQYQIAGGKVTFAGSGVASNSVTYQWTCNGTNIAWATNGVLVLTNVTAAQEGVYNFTVSDGISILTSSNAWFYLVPPPAISSQTLPTNVVCIYGNYLSFAAAATAPYQTNGYPLHYQWQFNGTNIPSATTTNYSFFASDSSSGTYSLAVTNRAGSASASWQVTVTNAINVTNDLLLIYNTNSTDSATVLNYYLAHRPGVSGANVLGIGYTNPISTGYYETVTPTDLTNQIFAPVVYF